MRILMVCLGNICRSPMAHGIFEHLVKEQGLDWHIDSAGTSDWHQGQAPDKRTIKIAQKHGIDISHQRAQHFTAELYDQYDLILAMDKKNYTDIVSLARNEQEREKVRMYLDREEDVLDPYFDDSHFAPVFEVVYQRASDLIEELKNR